MKPLQLSGLLVCAAFFVSCAETETASNSRGPGKSERAKRLAAQQQQSQHEQPDEAQQNLWNAQRNVMNRDGSVPFRGY